MAYFDLSSKNLTRYWAVSYVALLIFDTVNLSGRNVNCPGDNYIGESGRRLVEHVEDHSSRDNK